MKNLLGGNESGSLRKQLEMVAGVRRKVLQLKYEFGSIVGEYPLWYEIWCQLASRDALTRFVSHETDIVIEGFPRSGNTFAVAAFIIAQNREVKIARHTHKVMQVVRAVQLNKPTLVLIRQPADAVVSLAIRHPYITLQQALKIYIRYYNGIRPYRSSYVLTKFEDVITDCGKVIEKVNEHFGSSFEIFHHSHANKAKAFQLIEEMHVKNTGKISVNERAVARPSTKRSESKARLSRDLEYGGSRVMLEKANDVYRLMLQL